MPHSTEILTERLEQKLVLLVQLRDLGLHQVALIGAGDMNALLKLLSAKQRLLAALHSLERALDPFRQDDPEARAWTSPAQRESAARTATACEELLRSIVEQERQSEAAMSLRRDEAAARLQGAHSAAHVHHAYLTESSHHPNQLDVTEG